jgi:hypothetical protein
MNTTASHHPTEEALVECALHEGDEMLLAHIEQCTQCSEYIEDIRLVTRDITALDDEPVPERINAAILSIARKRQPDNYVLNFLQTWYKNPFLIGMVTIGIVLLLYAVLVMHL